MLLNLCSIFYLFIHPWTRGFLPEGGGKAAWGTGSCWVDQRIMSCVWEKKGFAAKCMHKIGDFEILGPSNSWNGWNTERIRPPNRFGNTRDSVIPFCRCFHFLRDTHTHCGPFKLIKKFFNFLSKTPPIHALDCWVSWLVGRLFINRIPPAPHRRLVSRLSRPPPPPDWAAWEGQLGGR